MNSSIIILTTLIICNYYNAEVFCMPIAQPQLTLQQIGNGNFGTTPFGGTPLTDEEDDCVEAAINSGFAANGQVGVAFNLVGLNTGEISCEQLLNAKQGKKYSLIVN